jgi:uncharacterized protein (DUF2062 family)
MTQTNDVEPPSPPAAGARARIAQALGSFLHQGHTPEKVALSIALGIAIGLFPIFGTTTVLCVVAAVALRLNHPAIQVTNQLMYPVQIPLMVVFVRIGEAMLGVAPIPFSATVLVAELRANPSTLFERFGTAGLHGILGWAIVAPVVAGLTYVIVLPAVRIVSRRPRPAETAAPPSA